MPNLKKIKIVDELTHTLQQTPNYILLHFGTTSHQKLEEIRKKLRLEKDTRIQIVKNSLLKVAAKKSGKKELTEQKSIRGPSALFTLPHDWSSALALLHQFAKAEGTISFKIGVIDKVVYASDQLTRIAELPPKNILLSTIVRTLKSPHTRLAFTMKWGMMRIVRVLKTGKRGE